MPNNMAIMNLPFSRKTVEAN